LNQQPKKITILAEVVTLYYMILENKIDFAEFQFPNLVKLDLLRVEVSHLSKLNECSTLSDLLLRDVDPMDDEVIDCSRLRSLNADSSYFKCLGAVDDVKDVTFYDLESDFFEDPVEQAIDECSSMEKLVLENLNVEWPLNSESLKRLISLSLISVNLTSLEIFVLPLLKELILCNCWKLEKLILNNSSLQTLCLTGKPSSKWKYALELIEFQSPALQRVVVKNMSAVKSPVKCIMNRKNIISNFIAENSSVHILY
jgi:hypothetical protein